MKRTDERTIVVKKTNEYVKILDTETYKSYRVDLTKDTDEWLLIGGIGEYVTMLLNRRTYKAYRIC